MNPKQMFLATALFGVVMAVAMVVAAVPGGGAYDALFSLIFLSPPDPVGSGGQFLAGVAGGVFAGWSTMLLVLARDPEISAMPGLWEAVLWGLGVWFLLDSGASILTGAAWNVLGNTVFLVGAGLPALLLRRRPEGAAVGA